MIDNIKDIYDNFSRLKNDQITTIATEKWASKIVGNRGVGFSDRFQGGWRRE